MKTISAVLPVIVDAVVSALIGALIGSIFFNINSIIFFIYLFVLVIAIYFLFGEQLSLSVTNLKKLISGYSKRDRRKFFLIFFMVSTSVLASSYLYTNSSNTIPDLPITLINNEPNEIHISNRGEFFPIETGGSGKIELKTSNTNYLSNLIKIYDDNYLNELIIPPNEQRTVYAHVINPTPYLSLYKREDIDILLTLHTNEGRLIIIDHIPFDKDTFSQGILYTI